MNRRGFFSALAGITAATAIPAVAEPKQPEPVTDFAATPVMTFPEPITGMVTFQDRLIVTAGAKVYEVRQGGF